MSSLCFSVSLSLSHSLTQRRADGHISHQKLQRHTTCQETNWFKSSMTCQGNTHGLANQISNERHKQMRATSRWKGWRHSLSCRPEEEKQQDSELCSRETDDLWEHEQDTNSFCTTWKLPKHRPNSGNTQKKEGGVDSGAQSLKGQSIFWTGEHFSTDCRNKRTHLLGNKTQCWAHWPGSHIIGAGQ